MSYISDIWLYSLQDWWRTVNEMSNFMYTGQIGNFIFRPVHKCTITTVSGFTEQVSSMIEAQLSSTNPLSSVKQLAQTLVC